MADRFTLRKLTGGSTLRGGDLLRLVIANATSAASVTAAVSSVPSATAAITSTPSVTD